MFLWTFIEQKNRQRKLAEILKLLLNQEGFGDDNQQNKQYQNCTNGREATVSST